MCITRLSKIRNVKGLTSKEDLLSSLETMVAKIELPINQKKFAKFNKILQLEFTDDKSMNCYIVFKEGSASISDGGFQEAELKIITTTEIIMAVIDGSQSPIRAFVSGKIRAQGPMNDLIKLQALMKK